MDFLAMKEKMLCLVSSWNFRSRVAGTIFQGDTLGPCCGVISFPAAPCAQSLFRFGSLDSAAQYWQGRETAGGPMPHQRQTASFTVEKGWGWEVVDIHILLGKHGGLACIHSRAMFHTQTDD